MKNAQPLFDPTTHYRIKLRGRVDVEWLQGFESSVESSVDEASQVTVLEAHTDQSGIVGLLRRLHGLGLAILELRIVK